MRHNLFHLTIAGEPYLYFIVRQTTFLWMNISQTRYTLVSPGEYVLIDRHFNCLYMTQAQMKACISSDFKRWKRPDLDTPPPTENDDE